MSPAEALASNVRALRAVRGLTQAALAKAAGVPRPTLTTLESGSANPTLRVLTLIAGALRVPIEELLAPPRSAVQLFPAADLPKRRKGTVEIRTLLPERVPGLLFERIEVPARARMTGAPHMSGSREYFVCERGAIELVVGGETLSISAGDVAVFRGDQKHSYLNPHQNVAVGFSVIALR